MALFPGRHPSPTDTPCHHYVTVTKYDLSARFVCVFVTTNLATTLTAVGRECAQKFARQYFQSVLARRRFV